jgi:lysine biosynthesis protein LysW
MIGICLECDEQIELDDDADVGDIVECPHCKTRQEILDLNPVVLDFAD